MTKILRSWFAWTLAAGLVAGSLLTVPGLAQQVPTTAVTVASLPLPSGAATEATLATIDADTGGMLTALQLLDNIVSGNEAQVDIVAALPTGANVIGGVTQSGTWNVTNISGTISLPTGAATASNQSTANTALQLLDNAVGSGPGGGTAATASLLAGGVYNSTLPTLTNGQQAGFQFDDRGRAIVSIGAGSTAGPTDTEDGGIAGGQTVAITASLNYVHNGTNWVRASNADATHGETAFATGPQEMGVGSTSAPTAVTAGQAVRRWLTLNGAGVDTLVNGSGTSAFGPAGTAATPVLTVQGISGATPLIDNITQLGGNAINLGAGAVGTGTQRVIIANDDDVSDMATLLEANLVAHDAADAGNPLKIGARAVAFGATPTAIAAGDRTDLITTRGSGLWVQNGHPNVIREEVTIADADGAQTNAAVVTVSAGTKIVIVDAYAACANTNTGDVSLRLGFGTSTLPSASTTGATGIVLSVPAFDANTGVSAYQGSPIAGADDEDLRLTMDDPAGGSCRIVYTYYTVAS